MLSVFHYQFLSTGLLLLWCVVTTEHLFPSLFSINSSFSEKKFSPILQFYLFASATVSFENCTHHFVRNTPPSQLPPADVSIALCKGGSFALSYDKPFLNPQYSTWSVTPQQVLDNIAGRNSNFRQDVDLRDLKIPQANGSSAAFSTLYNKGHIAPSRMLSSSDWGKYQTYFYSNVAPQWWTFNQQSWQYTEAALFDFVGARGRGSPSLLNQPFFVATAVDYSDRESSASAADGGVKTVGAVGVPDFFFTAICNPVDHQSVGFIGINNGTGGEGGFLFTYRSVRELEILFSSTSGTIFDDLVEDGSAAACNTRRINATYWGLNRFTSISTWPSSKASSLGVGGGGPSSSSSPSSSSPASSPDIGATPPPLAASYVDDPFIAAAYAAMVPLTASSPSVAIQNETTTNYSHWIAVDTFRIEFRGADWDALIFPRDRFMSSSSAAAEGGATTPSATAEQHQQQQQQRFDPDAYALNNGNHSAVRDCILGTFRRQMRLGNRALMKLSSPSSSSSSSSSLPFSSGERGFLQWPAHGYALEAHVMYAVPSSSSMRMRMRMGMKSDAGYDTNERDREEKGGGGGGVAASRRNPNGFGHQLRAVSSPSSSSSSSSGVGVRGGGSEEGGLVFEFSVHRLRSLGLPSDNTVSHNVTAAIASALRGANFSMLLNYYMIEVQRVLSASAERRTVVNPSYFGGFLPLHVTILSSDGGNGGDPTTTSSSPPAPTAPPTAFSTSSPNGAPRSQHVAGAMGWGIVFGLMVCYSVLGFI